MSAAFLAPSTSTSKIQGIGGTKLSFSLSELGNDRFCSGSTVAANCFALSVGDLECCELMSFYEPAWDVWDLPLSSLCISGKLNDR